MIAFIIIVVLGIIGIITSFFPQVISILSFFGVMWLGLICAFVAFVLFLIEIKQKRKNNFYLMTVIIYILYILFLPDIYHMIRGYYLVNKHLNEYSDSHKMLGIKYKNYKSNDGDSCDYVFNVQLNNNENITFQSGYCSLSGSGVMWTTYDTIDNYVYSYTSYYYDKYKNTHPIAFTLETEDSYYLGYKSITINYSKSDFNDICNFLDYLDKKISNTHYQIILHNIEDNTDFYVNDGDYIFCRN